MNRSGFDLPRLAHHRDDVLAVVVDGEILQRPVVGRLVVGVAGDGIVAGADAGAADIEVHPGGGEEVDEELLPRVGRKLVEEVARGVGEGGAEAEDLLVLLLGVHLHDR